MATAYQSNFDSLFLRFLGPGALPGITVGTWLRLLARNRFAVSWPYWGRAASITLAATLNSLGRVREEFRFGAAIERATVHPPVFVLGAWRSGTTHLHNLLCRDARFAFPNQYQVMNPHVFLSYESWMPDKLRPYFPETRPQDNVRIDVLGPQEDEFALTMISGLAPSFGWIFPQNHAAYDRYVDFLDASADEVDRWRAAVQFFVRKLSYRYDRPLVLKSPMHTARIRLLLELYPDAKFVFIHRHPYEVFASSQHLTRKSVPLCALQRYDMAALCDRMVPLYERLIDAYLDQRGEVPEGNLVEVAYQELDRSPVETMRRVYERLGLPEFAEAEPSIREYLAEIDGYRKNDYPPLPEETREMIARRWARSFAEWGYAA